MSPILDYDVARERQGDFLREAENLRLTRPLIARPHWHRSLRTRAGQLLVSIGTMLASSERAQPAVDLTGLTPDRVDG